MKTTTCLLLILLSLSCQNAKTKQIAAVESPAVFYLYGELSPEGYIDPYHYSVNCDSITLPYGFRVERVSGCEVDNALLGTVARNNKKSLRLMNTRYGKDWRQRFEQQSGQKLTIPAIEDVW